MKKPALLRLSFAFLLSVSVLGMVAAQESKPASSQSEAQQAAQPQQPENPNTAIGQQLASESHAAEESAEHEENAQFKYSPSVRWIAKRLNGDPHLAYFVSLVINFGLLAIFFYVLLKSRLPQAFRERTLSIQRSIREAQESSAAAQARLQAIEARMAKLDIEVDEIRSEAERIAVAEEQRIRQAAEQDKQKIIASAESEISAIARNARRELKSFAASLAVDLAAKKIHVDDKTDHALIREFAEQLGKDGK